MLFSLWMIISVGITFLAYRSFNKVSDVYRYVGTAVVFIFCVFLGSNFLIDNFPKNTPVLQSVEIKTLDGRSYTTEGNNFREERGKYVLSMGGKIYEFPVDQISMVIKTPTDKSEK